jgi:hypothetical protein
MYWSIQPKSPVQYSRPARIPSTKNDTRTRYEELIFSELNKNKDVFMLRQLRQGMVTKQALSFDSLQSEYD